MMSKFKLGDEYWTYHTDAEIYGEVYWPFINLQKFTVKYPYQENECEQEFYFKTKDEAIDSLIKYIKELK